MKKILLITALFVLPFLGMNEAFAQSIWTNDIENVTNAHDFNPYSGGQIFDSNLQSVSGIGRGIGIIKESAGNRYNAKGWDTTTFDSTAYFYFTLTPGAGFQINFESFVYTGQVSSTGPTNFVLRSSIDSYAAEIVTTGDGLVDIDLSNTVYQGITTPITFRLYAWGASASTGTFSINDFTFNGVVESSCTKPATPDGAIAISESCGSKTFTYTPTPITDIKFYWQTTDGGTSILDEATALNNTKTVTTNDTVWYIRAINTDGDCWSVASISADSGTLKTVPVFNTHPQNIGVSDGSAEAQNIVLTATTTAQAGTTYVWQVNQGSGWTDITTNSTYTVSGLQLTIIQATLAMNGYQYRVKAVNTPCEATSNVALLNVKKLPTISDIDVASPNAVCGSAEITVTALNTTGGTSGLDYTWYKYDETTDSDWVTITNTGVYSGATTAVLTISSTLGLNGVQYYVRVQENAVNCYAASSTVKTTDNNTTWNGTTWSNGAPDLTKAVVIDSPYSTTTSGSFAACSCEVTATGSLTIGDGAANDYIVLKNGLLSSNAVTVNNNASLIQVDDNATNTGTITVKRDSKPMNKYGYTYWGTPVSGQTTTGLYAGINNMRAWNAGNQAWVVHAGAMLAPNGYISRAPQSTPWNTQTGAAWNRYLVSASFTGVPNNGVFTATIEPDTTVYQPYEAGARMSFIGNPYPSALNIDQFFDDNTGVVIPTIYLWTHSSDPELIENAYVYAGGDFAVYSILGGVGTEPNVLPTGTVASGQGFFIRGTTDGGTATFSNSQRYGNTATDPTAFPNNNFFRMHSDSQTSSTNFEKHRFWLNLRGEAAQFKQTLVGYATDATDQIDYLDGEYYKAGNTIDLYSLTGTKELAIQSRALPFDDTDTIVLGYKATTAGTYTFSLENFDNLFVDQDIYIKDNADMSRHNLKDGAYTFATDAGEFTTRFEVVFRSSDLSVTNPINDSRWVVYTKDNQLQLEAIGFAMKDVVVYDMLGRTVYTKQDINAASHTIDKLGANQVYIVKMLTEDNQSLVKKVSF